MCFIKYLLPIAFQVKKKTKQNNNAAKSIPFHYSVWPFMFRLLWAEVLPNTCNVIVIVVGDVCPSSFNTCVHIELNFIGGIGAYKQHTCYQLASQTKSPLQFEHFDSINNICSIEILRFEKKRKMAVTSHTHILHRLNVSSRDNCLMWNCMQCTFFYIQFVFHGCVQCPIMQTPSHMSIASQLVQCKRRIGGN